MIARNEPLLAVPAAIHGAVYHFRQPFVRRLNGIRSGSEK